MCRLGVHIADGVIVWLAPPPYVASIVLPMVHAGAARANRKPPRIIVGAPATASTDRRSTRDTVRASFGVYASLPYYVQMLRAAGLPGADNALTRGWSDEMVDAVFPAGGEAGLDERINEYLEAGADEVVLAPFGVGATTALDTLDALTAIVRRRR